MENFSEQTSELLQSKTASQSHSAAVPAPGSSPPAMPMPVVSVEQAALEFHRAWSLNNNVCIPFANPTSLHWFPNPLPPNVPFLYSAFGREANEKVFSKLCVGEVSTPLAWAHEYKHTRVPDDEPKALKISSVTELDWLDSQCASNVSDKDAVENILQIPKSFQSLPKHKKHSHHHPLLIQGWWSTEGASRALRVKGKKAHQIMQAGCTGVCKNVCYWSIFQFTNPLFSCL